MDCNLDKALELIPYEFDGLTILSDKIVLTRKENKCWHCKDHIEKQEKNRVMRSVCDGEMHSHRFCFQCCQAMIRELDSDGDSFDFYDRWVDEIEIQR